MYSRDQAAEAVRKVMAFSRAEGTEVILEQHRSGLTRMANNGIHQNVNEETTSLSVRVILGRRTGRATTNRLDDEGLRSAAAMAREAALDQPEDPSVLPLPAAEKYEQLNDYSPRTAAWDPSDRARMMGNIASSCRRRRCEGSGALSTGEHLTVVGTSTGMFAYARRTDAELTLTVTSKEGMGGASIHTKDIGAISGDVQAEQAIARALASRKPRPLRPGTYAVILDPIAAAGLIEHLAYLAFNALPVQEGRSFLSGKIGRRVFGENITIVDDVRDPQTMGIPFDYEGVPRQKVMLIERGIARGVVHDRVTASRARVRSTGHALPQPNTEGPVPLNIVVSSGNSTLEEMIASTETGVLVNQVHYTNVVDPMRITLTGMTRGGTFWIENGKVTHALRNLRFTESLVDVLNRVDGMTRERLYAGDYLGVVAPGMKVTAFTFTSGTDF